MSSLQIALAEYLSMRRALGYKLLLEGRLLRRFIEFAKHARADYIHRTGLEVGNPAGPCTAVPVGQPLRDGAPLRAVLLPQRSAHRCTAA